MLICATKTALEGGTGHLVQQIVEILDIMHAAEIKAIVLYGGNVAVTATLLLDGSQDLQKDVI